MSQAKINVKIGDFSFSGEGDSGWLSKELDKILAKAEELIKLTPPPSPDSEKENNKNNLGNISLAKFLRDKNATSVQNEKFLVTSIWLHKSKGMARLKTSDVSKALKDASQSKLGNPSECLSQAVKSGNVEKDGSKDFFVTQHGFEKVGC